MKKIKEAWASLDNLATVSKRELFLGLTCCALAGIVLGVFCSPKKTVSIGSNNGANRNNGNIGSMGDANADSGKEETVEGCE